MFFEVRIRVAETARLHRAARRGVLGIEIQDEVLLPDEIPQADPLSPCADQREVGGLRADLGYRVHLHAVPPSNARPRRHFLQVPDTSGMSKILSQRPWTARRHCRSSGRSVSM